MIGLFILLGLGDVAGFVHFIAHHRTGLTGVVLAFGGWVAHRVRRRFRNTGHRIAPPELQKALKAERRQARKAVAA